MSMIASLATATGVPIGGFLPLVGLGLSDEFQNQDAALFFQSQLEPSLVGNSFGAGGTPYYDLALVDTGAAVSLITSEADAAFDIDGAGFRGTGSLTIGGATGFLQATINDPLAMFVTGTANVTGTGPLTVNTSTLVGQSSVSILTIPPESDLPNVVGIPLLSQYATYIRSDQPQIFQNNGKTVRTPQIDFLPLGAGGQGITRRAPMQLKSGTGSAFITAPVYVFNFENINNGRPWTENPTTPTILQEPGAFFLNVDVENEGESLNNFEFFFDTGASVTVVSELNALRLGFDPTLDEPDFTIAVTGSAGVNQEVPGFFVEEFTIQAVGGSITATNVPVIVLDIADPTNPANIVDGIVGTNLLAGRNVVIDPKPSLGGGGIGPSLYISDPITSEFDWSSTSASGSWASGGNWSGPTAPSNLGIANVRHVAGGNQTALLSTDTTVWELNISGTPSQTMTVQVGSGQTLTTFAATNIETGGVLKLVGGTLDTQYLEMLGGTLSGDGQIKTGSGPISGQVENRGGTVSPGNGVGRLEIVGRFANGADGTLAIEIGGLVAETMFDVLVVDGPATLAGILDVSLVDLGSGLFDPQLGDTFEIFTASEGLSGTFESLMLPAGYDWFVKYNSNSVELVATIPGDFDGDGDADATDLAIWRAGYGSGSYNGADFLEWQRNFNSGGNLAASATVPEPGSLALLFAACGLAMASRRAG
ncbi:MAG: PEP-CTERM sorting domain-containing protein [Planctomycetes bacterium]|nr:PEP-CTERM sorting domain-containing protein [Planctomycetota bacterium]